jgi:glycogen debranching enzyme
MDKFTKYLSKLRKEEIISVKESNIKYPSEMIKLITAVNSIILKYDQTRHTFLAAGVMQENENSQEANLFNTVFGRDSLIMLDFARLIIEKNAFDPSSEIVALPDNIDRDVLYFLASYQGQTTNPNSEEVMGKILHEYRDKDDAIAIEMETLKGWQFPYFGGIDSTFYYIKSLSKYLLKNPSEKDHIVHNHLSGKEYTLLQSLHDAVHYTVSLVSHGMVFYTRQNEQGIEIQSWRDSYDSISTSNGDLPDYLQPICLLDIQLVAIEAYESVSQLYLFLSEIIKYASIKNLSNILKTGLNQYMWVQVDKYNGYYAMGTQKVNEEFVKFDCVSSSNLVLLGHDFIDSKKKEQIFNYTYNRLRVPNGIATIATDEVRYHPSGYHTGNVWLFDNVLAALGLLAINKVEEAYELSDCIDRIINTTNCYPELVGSHDMPNNYIIDVKDLHDNITNRICQPGQPIQGWTVMSYLALKTILHRSAVK